MKKDPLFHRLIAAFATNVSTARELTFRMSSRVSPNSSASHPNKGTAVSDASPVKVGYRLDILLTSCSMNSRLNQYYPYSKSTSMSGNPDVPCTGPGAFLERGDASDTKVAVTQSSVDRSP